jgi:hypothetical protein
MGVALTAGIAMLAMTAGASSGATLSSAAKIAGQVGKITNIASTAVSGATNIAGGVNKIDVAFVQKDADLARAGKAEFDKALVKLQAAMQDEQESIKEILEHFNAAMGRP